VKRRHPEQVLHLAAAQYLRLALRPPTLWFAVDHGAGQMTPAAAGLLKGRGGRRGMPDLMVMHPAPSSTVVLGVELKAATGQPSPAQELMALQFRAANASYEFCWSLEDIQRALRTNGIPVHARVAGNGSLWAERPGAA
jgi:hypothetical protein